MTGGYFFKNEEYNCKLTLNVKVGKREPQIMTVIPVRLTFEIEAAWDTRNDWRLPGRVTTKLRH